jgi:hypothetical protein
MARGYSLILIVLKAVRINRAARADVLGQGREVEGGTQ